MLSRYNISSFVDDSKMIEMKKLRSFYLEPTIVLYIFAFWIVRGGGINTTLLIHKVCTKELNYTEDVCNHLDADENEAIETQVQRRVNHVQMVTSFLGSVPSVFYSLFVGALSDESGRKPLMIMPIVGQIVGSLCDIANVIWIDTLPVEFFYTEEIYAFFGGQSVYYLGYYGYGSSVSTQEKRATLLARYDGVEQGKKQH